MSYKVRKRKGKNDIIEKDTNMVIHSSTDYNESRNICRSLNLGAGFQGFTPSFFTLDYDTKKGKLA